MLVLFLTLAYVAGVGLWARPLVTNATVGGGGGSSRRDAAAG